MKEDKESQGEKFDRKETLEKVKEAWPKVSGQIKWEKYGVGPAKPPKEKTPGNYIVFFSRFKADKKSKGIEEKEKGQFNEEAKAVWAAMSND